MRSFERASLQPVKGYVPGEQPQNQALVKLNTNENPYPPAPEVLAALSEIPAEALRRYPNPTAEAFRRRAANLHGLTPDQLIATNGGDELLRLIFHTFAERGEQVLTTEPSYSLYEVLAAVHGITLNAVPLDAAFAVPEDFETTLAESKARIAFVVNPHAPSGKLFTRDEVRRWLEVFQGVLVIDEAYVDFVSPARKHELVSLIETHPNLLLLRTLSKGYGLAGLRFGYGLGQAALLAPMRHKTQDSYSTDAVAQQLAERALEAQDYAATTWERVRDSRAALQQGLRALGLSCFQSETNFVLTRVPGGAAEARRLCDCARDAGILLRYFDTPRLRDCIRISVGTEAQQASLLAAWQAALA